MRNFRLAGVSRARRCHAIDGRRLPSREALETEGSKWLNERTTRHGRLARIRYGCASTDSTWTRRTHACYATEALSLSRRRPSTCCARSCGNRGHCSRPTRCSTKYGATSSSADSVLRTAISELRTALDDDARKPRFIETVSRRGYRFIAATNAIVAAPTVAQSFHKTIPPSRPHSSGVRKRFRDFAPSGTSRARENAGSCGLPVKPGIGKTTLIEHFIDGSRRCSLHPRPMRRSIRQRRALPPRARSAIGAVPHRQHARGVVARGRADLALAAAVVQHRRGARRSAAGARRCRGGSHATRDGRASGSLGRAPAAVACDRGPPLERSRDDPAHRLRRATARQRAPHVARKLSPRRSRGARSSAQPVAARAADARAVRRDRAGPVLGNRGRGIRGGTIAIDRRATKRSCARCTSAPTECRCSSHPS